MQPPDLRDIVKICPSSPCVEVLFANCYFLAHIVDGIEIMQKKSLPSLFGNMTPWKTVKCYSVFSHVCPFIVGLWQACIYPKHAQYMISSNHRKLCFTWCILLFCALQQFCWKSTDLHTQGWPNNLNRHLHKTYPIVVYGKSLWNAQGCQHFTTQTKNEAWRLHFQPYFLSLQHQNSAYAFCKNTNILLGWHEPFAWAPIIH